jgi:hypothetical protein
MTNARTSPPFHARTAGRDRPRTAQAQRPSRRGIATLLAMMFLIIFGSLCAAMSVASTGNVRTANMHLHVMRAMGAAETGMAIAEARLAEAASRFVVSSSEITPTRVRGLWNGTSADVGSYTVLDPFDDYPETADPSGIAQALVNHHTADSNRITLTGFPTAATIGTAPSGTPSSTYQLSGWVFTPAVAVEPVVPGQAVPPPAYLIRYAPLADWSAIRVIVQGYAFEAGRQGTPISRTVVKDFQLRKTINHAVISNSRVLIGKNTIVDGTVATRYDEVDAPTGDPLVMRSDFFGLNAVLDAKLTDLYAAIAASDADGDNRLRINHPVEGVGIPADDDYDGNGANDGAFADVTGDGYVDEFDVFISHYDTDGDDRVTLSTPLTLGTPAQGRAAEFVAGGGVAVDDALALMIDSALPDRNRNGVSGHVETTGNNRFDADTEDPADYDAVHDVYPDRELGWRDGFIDVNDQYAKVRGGLVFGVSEAGWIAEQGDYAARLQGTVVPTGDRGSLTFVADAADLPLITAASFQDNENAIIAAADGSPFWQQAADQLGVSLSAIWDTANAKPADWNTSSNPVTAGAPWYQAVWSDDDLDGLPDNHATAYFEQSPFNTPVYADLYFRPVFRNMTFRNVQIPMGLNALFENCTFVGSTYVRAHTANSHVYWNELGALNPGSTGRPVPRYPRYVYGDDAGLEPAADAPRALPATAKPPSANVLMTAPSISPLDKGDVRISEEGNLIGVTYAQLPEPLIISGKRVIDTKQHSNNIRFHNCLFVGSIVSDSPQIYTQVRNKLQFTGATRFSDVHPTQPTSTTLNPDAADKPTLAKSSMMLPNYSVDIGSFNSPQAQDVRLTGAIVAGVLDARGNITIDGALLMTFDAELGTAPMIDAFGNPVGNPAGFNGSLGYFGSDEGDFESLDPADLPIVGGVRIVGWDTNGDGLVDLPHTVPQPPGSTAVPFNGFGSLVIRHDPDMTLPDGLMLPMSVRPVFTSYREGSY